MPRCAGYPAFAGYDGLWCSRACAYLPNSRSTSQPSSPAADSGRADGLGGGAEVRVGGGRYEPPDGAGLIGAALDFAAVWSRFDMKPPRCVFGKPATGTP